VLATLIIGLREGLEAALVVGIIAAFLRRNGAPLTAMWVGVGAAVVVSFSIAGGLVAVEGALPQAAQDGMEALIGLLAVVFVTTMVLWMNRHARFAKQHLEEAATKALRSGTARTLAVMAFLAVLKEGFETSVFLTATFRAAVDPGFAAAGAVLGLSGAVVIGIGLYTGGVRLNLRRFYRWTSPFLVLLAAGLLLTAVREAHGAGWIDAGQQPTVDLGWFAPRGSVGGALVTGVFGIPPDPRLIEVLAWFAYVIPTLLMVLWPPARRPTDRVAARLRIASAFGLIATALILAIAVPAPHATDAPLPLAAGGTATIAGDQLAVARAAGTERVPLRGRGEPSQSGGLAMTTWRTATTTHPASPELIGLDQLIALSGGRLPVGISATTNPGPFTARWTQTLRTVATTGGGRLLDAGRTGTAVLTLSGGGLTASRTITVPAERLQPDLTWRVSDSASSARLREVREASAAAPERRLWGTQVPGVLVILGVAMLLPVVVRPLTRRGGRRSSDLGTAPPRSTCPAPSSTSSGSNAQPTCRT
jgi:high-affinity iron transporter